MTRTNPLFLAMLEAHKKREAERASSVDWSRLTSEEFFERADLCDLGLSDGQRALVRGSDGSPVTHLDPLDLEYHLGTRGPFVPHRRPKLVACRSGRRSGKSLVAILRQVEHGLRVTLRRPPEEHERADRDGLVGIGKGERVRIAVVAARVTQSLGTFQLALSRIEQSPKLSRYLVSKGATRAMLKRDDGQLIEVEILAAASRGTNLRSGWFIGAVLDEADFFGEQDASVTLEDQIKAVRPALVSGGQIWLCTSPWDDSGQFAKIHAAAFGEPDDVLAFHSSTQRMNPTYPAADIEIERKKDPDFVAREFDAIPMASGSDQFFPEASIVAACTRDEPFKLKPNGAPHWAGCDPGLRKNSATLALARNENGRVVLAYYEELVPAKKSAEQAAEDRRKGLPPGLAPSVVFTTFARTALAYQAVSVRGDQYYEDSAIEHMPTVQTPNGDTVWYETFVDNSDSTAAIFTAFRSLLNEGKIDLPRDPRLMQQLKDTKIRKGPGGKIHVALPKTGAAHGDLLKAVVLACVQVPLTIDHDSNDESDDWSASDSRWGAVGRGF